MYIPSSEIKQPDLHADTLGFTFVWHGHFLRGIFPESVELAKSYFETGFLDEVTSKGLFPKTWISEFENEQFGMIIEHELISPVLYATEWNFEMLKDAALMVLEIAQIGWKYGFNMVDCHKRNVLFKNNYPMYVDVGSFKQKEKGSTGWNPYTSFLRSYYYLLSVWSSGATMMAKRMMAPGLELSDKDYWAFKSLLFRRFPKLIKYYSLVQEGICRAAVWGTERASKEGKVVRLFKPIIDKIKPSRSQRLHAMERKVKRMKAPTTALSLQQEKKDRIDGFVGLISNHFPSAQSVTFINNCKSGYYRSIFDSTHVENINSVQENEAISNAEYKEIRRHKLQVCSSYLRLLNNTILVRGQFPEDRLRSDLAFIPQFLMIEGSFSLHNSVVFVEHCLGYARNALVLGIENRNDELAQVLEKKHKTMFVPISFNDATINKDDDNNVQMHDSSMCNVGGGGVSNCLSVTYSFLANHLPQKVAA